MHDAQIRVAIAGAGGRMGRQLIQATMAMEGVQLGAALERDGSSLLGSDAGELAGVGKSGVTGSEQPRSGKRRFRCLYRFYPPGRHADASGILSAACKRHGDWHDRV